jgi:hypothetical protein
MHGDSLRVFENTLSALNCPTKRKPHTNNRSHQRPPSISSPSPSDALTSAHTPTPSNTPPPHTTHHNSATTDDTPISTQNYAPHARPTHPQARPIPQARHPASPPRDVAYARSLSCPRHIRVPPPLRWTAHADCPPLNAWAPLCPPAPAPCRPARRGSGQAHLAFATAESGRRRSSTGAGRWADCATGSLF